MVRFITIAMTGVLLAACGDTYNIDGKTGVSRFDGKTVYLRMLDDAGTVVDSAEVVHGTFKMSGNVDSVMMLMLCMDDEGITPLVLENGYLSVDISNNETAVSGTPLNDSLYSFLKHKKDIDTKLNEMDTEIARRVLAGDNYDVVKMEVGDECDSLCNGYNSYIEDFISSNFDNVLSSGVFLLICRSTPREALPESFSSLIRSAPDDFKSQPIVAEYLKGNPY